MQKIVILGCGYPLRATGLLLEVLALEQKAIEQKAIELLKLPNERSRLTPTLRPPKVLGKARFKAKSR